MSSKTRFKFGFFGLIVAGVTILGYFALGNIFQREASISPDRLVSVEKGDLNLAVVATGSIVPVATVEIKSKASGLVKEIFVEEGEIVEPGQVLMELDKELLEAELREADANRLAVRARMEEARSEERSAQSMRRKLEMDLRNLEDHAQYLQKQVSRFEQLFAEKLIPHSDLEEQARLLQETRFKTEALRSELVMQDARIDASRKGVVRMEAEVSQAQAILDRRQENLRNATIRSPLRATVLKRHVEVGDAISSILQLGSQATLMLTLGDMQRVYFEGRVDETDIGRVFERQRARVRVDAFRDQPLMGKVTRIAPLGEEADNVIGFEVRVNIDDPDRILRAQMSANAEIIVEEKSNVLVIPESAVIYDEEQRTFASVPDPSSEGGTRRQAIETGISNGTLTEVVSGLKEGNKVIRADHGGIL